MCKDGYNKLSSFIDIHSQFALNLTSKWGGLTFIAPSSGNETYCGATWRVDMVYVYQGSSSDPNFYTNFNNLIN